MEIENENLDVVEETLPEEETTQEEVTETEEENTEEAEVTLSKEEFTKLKRKAIAYDANKGKQKVDTPKTESTNSDYLEDIFMVKDLSEDEYKTLKGEAKDLGIDFKRYITSQSGKTVLDKMRSEKKSRDSMEKLSSKSPVYKKFTQEDISKMSASEMEKILTSN